MARKSQRTRRRYERRLILFIDFLGFKEHVDRTTTDPEYLTRLIDAMNLVGKIGKGLEELHRSQAITQFSDCIVASYRITEASAVFDLLSEVALCVIELAWKGFLVRGGVTVGDLYHTKSHIVGPAMVEAYRLESKVAEYPRIVIDHKVVAVARQSHRDGHTPDDEERYVRDFMTKDDDGQFFFDYVSWDSVVRISGGDDDLYPEYLQAIGRLIKEGLAKPDLRVVKKYLWLHKQFVAAIVNVETIPSDGAYRIENWEACAAIESLPKLVDLATKATARVAAQAKSKTDD